MTHLLSLQSAFFIFNESRSNHGQFFYFVAQNPPNGKSLSTYHLEPFCRSFFIGSNQPGNFLKMIDCLN